MNGRHTRAITLSIIYMGGQRNLDLFEKSGIRYGPKRESKGLRKSSSGILSDGFLLFSNGLLSLPYYNSI